MKEKKKIKYPDNAGNWVGAGAAIGAAIFAATNEPVWIAIGVAIGAALGWKKKDEWIKIVILCYGLFIDGFLINDGGLDKGVYIIWVKNY